MLYARTLGAAFGEAELADAFRLAAMRAQIQTARETWQVGIRHYDAEKCRALYMSALDFARMAYDLSEHARESPTMLKTTRREIHAAVYEVYAPDGPLARLRERYLGPLRNALAQGGVVEAPGLRDDIFAAYDAAITAYERVLEIEAARTWFANTGASAAALRALEELTNTCQALGEITLEAGTKVWKAASGGARWVFWGLLGLGALWVFTRKEKQ